MSHSHSNDESTAPGPNPSNTLVVIPWYPTHRQVLAQRDNPPLPDTVTVVQFPAKALRQPPSLNETSIHDHTGRQGNTLSFSYGPYHKHTHSHTRTYTQYNAVKYSYFTMTNTQLFLAKHLDNVFCVFRVTPTVVSISAALYPCIDACLPLFQALICHVIHYPSVCFSWLLNDQSD